MRKSVLQLYAPFLVLALVQALLIAVAPSRGPQQQDLAAGSGAGFQEGGGGLATDGSATDGSSTDGTGTGGSGGSGGTGGVGGTGGATGGTGGTGGGTGAIAGDISHCVGQRQYGITRVGPPCKPKFVGSNGGATYKGVTDKTIKVLYFSSKPNAQVDAILATQGLVATEEQNRAALTAFFGFVNKHVEMYGRKIEWEWVQSECPTTPPDYDTCLAEARKALKKNPFAVIFATPLYATVFDVWANAGVISLGGWHFDKSYFTGRRPYRYDVFMDGTESADYLADYYCTKMARRKVSHSGEVIHATIGRRGEVTRHLGIVVPEIAANKLTAQRVQQKVKACSGKTPVLSTYKSDIETATTQSQATVSALISAGVTTVTCMCDPVAPAFTTKQMSANRYFPEFLLPGLGLLDYDLLGRIYDPEQMIHAFGPSHLGLNISLDDTDQARVWRSMGQRGHPCGDNGCGIPWAYISLLAAGIQMAGPTLNPLTFERGLLQDLPDYGGTVESPRVSFGPGDYTALSDAKEVFWSTSSRSRVDGKHRAFVAMNGGRRYTLGGWGSRLTVPVEPS